MYYDARLIPRDIAGYCLPRVMRYRRTAYRGGGRGGGRGARSSSLAAGWLAALARQRWRRGGRPVIWRPPGLTRWSRDRIRGLAGRHGRTVSLGDLTANRRPARRLARTATGSA